MADYDNPRPSSQPVGSTDQAVLRDNLISTDVFVTSDELEGSNRKGRPFTTMAGIDVKVNQAIQNAGDIPLNGGVWAAGQTFNAYNEYMIYNGVAYKPKTTTTLPYGLTGSTPDVNFVTPYSREKDIYDTSIDLSTASLLPGEVAETKGRLAIGDGMAYRYVISSDGTNLRPYDVTMANGNFAIFDGLISYRGASCGSF